MPWSYPNNVPTVSKNWTAAEQKKCTKAANAALEDGATEKEAIFACIAAAGKSKKKRKGSQQMGRAADQKTQEARSRRYKIQIRDDGNLTKPKKWDHLSDSQFGDPVNYMYPVPNRSHAENAKVRFAQHADKYDSRSRGVVRGRINRLCRKYDVDPIKASVNEAQKTLGGPKGGFRFFAEVIQDELEDDSPHFGLMRIPAARATVLHHPWWGDIYLDDDLFESFIDNWETNVLGFDLALDKEHHPEDGALAWIKDMEVEGDSFNLWVDPTSMGEGVLGDVWKYASIEYTEDYIDPETGISYGPTLRGCAATNRPFVHRQDAIQILSIGSGQCDDWQCKLSLDNEEDIPMNVTFDDTDILAVSPGEQDGGPVGDVESNAPVENTSQAPVENTSQAPVEDQPPITSGTQQPATSSESQPVPQQVIQQIKIGDATLTLNDVVNLVEQNQVLLHRDHKNRVSSVCETASARGVAPVVIETARQILDAVEPNAKATITLSVPGEQGAPVEKAVNLFGALAELLSLTPGYITEEPLSYQHQGDRPATTQNLSGNPYADETEETAEEAEAAARLRRKELGIRFSRTTVDPSVEM